MPYLLLGILGAGILAYAAAHVRKRPLVAALVALGASLGVSDLVVSGLLRLYTYRPFFFAEVRPDNGLGLTLADLIFVPFTYASLLTLLPRHRVAVSVAFVVLLSGIEILFLRLGIFIHHGWRLWYTPLLFGARFALAAWWLGIFERSGYTQGFRWLIVTSGTTYLWFLWVALSSAVAGLWNIYLGLLDPFRDAVLGHSLLHAPPAILGVMACAMIGGVRKATNVGVLVAAMALYLTGLEWLGLWRDRPPWSPIASALVVGGLALVVIYLDGWMAEAARPRIPAWKPPS
ncbi:MAG TPA: hypothetical protein VK464_12360 [Symbiobacteriaceae bacterium]|jgi:hypothetical protein|nr:hypothetical protein [Symbiobacteriaceae bacterium]